MDLFNQIASDIIGADTFYSRVGIFLQLIAVLSIFIINFAEGVFEISTIAFAVVFIYKFRIIRISYIG